MILLKRELYMSLLIFTTLLANPRLRLIFLIWYAHGQLSPFGVSANDKFYDGVRPEPTEDFQSSSISGIRLYDLEGLPEVDYCINAHIGRSHSCFESCGIPSDELDKSRDCSCDEECYLYNDCCLDYEIYCDGGSSEDITSGALPLYEASVDTNDTDFDLFFDEMDFFRLYIPENINGHFTNTDIKETCFVPSVGSDFSYFMIAKCPVSSSVKEHEKCLNHNSTDSVDSIIPVYSNSTGSFYSNRFCAACHGANNQTLKFMTLSCKWICQGTRSPSVNEAPQTLGDCQKERCFSLQWVFSPKPPRRCHPVIANCPINGVDNDLISKACHSYSAYLFGADGTEEHVYKNAHCAFCNNVKQIRNKCDGTYYEEFYGNVDSMKDQVPLTVLFDFSGGALQPSKSYGGPTCPDNFIFDSASQDCLRASCPPGSVFVYNQCIYDKDHQSNKETRTLSNNLDLSYRRVIIEFASNDKVSHEQFRALFQGFMSLNEPIQIDSIVSVNMSNTIDQNADEEMRVDWTGEAWVQSEYVEQNESCFKVYQMKHIATLEMNINETSINQFIVYIQDVLKRLPSCPKEFHNDYAFIKVSVFNFAEVKHLCTSNSSYRVPRPYGERSFSRVFNDSNDSYQIRLDFSENETITYNSVIVPQEIVFTSGKRSGEFGNWRKNEWVYLCEYGPICPTITMTREEYEWEIESDHTASLTRMASGKQIPNDDIGQILIDDGLVEICLNPDDFYHMYYAYSSGQTMVTVIGCVISLTLLALVIITYCTFSSLRNIPGKTVLSLSISLFMAQLLFLVAIGQTKYWQLCLTFACILHFFWLSVFAWTNVLAFDLAKTFGKNSGGVRCNNGASWCFIKYSLYAWGMPCVLVGVTVSLHFLHEIDGKLQNIYDLSNACWFRSGNILLIGFGIPVAIALTLNIGFFVYTVLGIRTTMKMAKILKKDKCDEREVLKKELKLYVRLSVCIGLPWISTFIIPYTGIPELGYLFIILNSLQGPVIFLSFICSHRVMKLWSNKFGSGMSLLTTSADRSTVGSRTTQTNANGRSTRYEHRNV